MTVAELSIKEAQYAVPVFRRILVAVDFSNVSRRALAQALALAAEGYAQLSVVHVKNPDWRYEMLENPPELDLEQVDAQQRIRALIQALGSERTIDTFVKHGAVAPEILSAAAQTECDLLVMGTRGRGGLSKLALGSVAEVLLRSASCPVMTVGPRVDIVAPQTRSVLPTILFATDFGKGSTKALPIVLALAKSYHSKLILLHMIEPMPATSGSLSPYAPPAPAAEEVQQWEGTSRKLCLQRLKEWLPIDPRLEQEPEYVVGRDFLPEGILMSARLFKADLLVMGANHTASARVTSHIPWTAVHEVISNAPCPVLTVAG